MCVCICVCVYRCIHSTDCKARACRAGRRSTPVGNTHVHAYCVHGESDTGMNRK